MNHQQLWILDFSKSSSKQTYVKFLLDRPNYVLCSLHFFNFRLLPSKNQNIKKELTVPRFQYKRQASDLIVSFWIFQFRVDTKDLQTQTLSNKRYDTEQGSDKFLSVFNVVLNYLRE